MKSLFSIHAGEYLVGSHIEKHYKRAHVWIPSRDTGIDLLVSDPNNQRTLSLQVKFSKDWLVTALGPEFQTRLRACGWWKLDRTKLSASKADYWVFVLQGFAARSVDFVVVPPQELSRRLEVVHGGQKVIQTYMWVTAEGKCWETRGLKKSEQRKVMLAGHTDKARDFTAYLNAWSPLSALNR